MGSSSRHLLTGSAVDVAPLLLGAVITHDGSTHDSHGAVSIRITEVEAYLGPHDSDAPDPGSHSFRGRTARNATMFGPAGHLYVYFTYGMHYCANIVCGIEGQATGCLLRAGEVIGGLEAARRRRPSSRKDHDLAQGPARLAQSLGIDRSCDGTDVFAAPFRLDLPAEPLHADRISTGPRVGVSGAGGTAAYPWRFWITGHPTVSRYRPAAVRSARRRTAEEP
jgi:DNA-3-methyladenine glycosylase